MGEVSSVEALRTSAAHTAVSGDIPPPTTKLHQPYRPVSTHFVVFPEIHLGVIAIIVVSSAALDERYPICVIRPVARSDANCAKVSEALLPFASWSGSGAGAPADFTPSGQFESHAGISPAEQQFFPPVVFL